MSQCRCMTVAACLESMEFFRSDHEKSGFANDGAEELQQLKRKGAVTFVQDKESSVVHGMPGEAIRFDAATFILEPGKIASLLVSLANSRRGEQ